MIEKNQWNRLHGLQTNPHTERNKISCQLALMINEKGGNVQHILEEERICYPYEKTNIVPLHHVVHEIQSHLEQRLKYERGKKQF